MRTAIDRNTAHVGTVIKRQWPFQLTCVYAAIASLLLSLIARSRERRALAALDERLLADVGIDRGAAAAECSKPPWRA